ncbi:1-acyl-sn-glycerol-3-phosphate acyltransferase [Bordetella sp. BOR01]|uniref:lysophospholipid acyltransferase family protein n=1 Tax=Bordetella sp. BOR01 TaxID=2854779 RepID=UPI001C459167|nr:lysophospholipid acyltransferase family protein [Bordetella sp. BOR01]MBV7484360.1 1-acyl-sn-glycerol-3-phosphate acyltransferase [Bordetella sp. BOR01]
MKLPRVVLRLVLVAPWIIFGLLCVGLVYPFMQLPARAGLNRHWSRCLMAMCGIRVVQSGTPLLAGPVLWVANHVSWIDIFVVNSVRATAFVAKSEIRNWPLIGWLAAGAGTLFIERGQRHAVHAVGESVQARFRQGVAVGLFPEGTTSEGDMVRPFHASLFEPARAAGVPIQPVVLRFLQHGQRNPLAAFVGEETLAANLWRVLGATGLSVEVEFLPPLSGQGPDGHPATRLELSRQAREAIAAAL